MQNMRISNDFNHAISAAFSQKVTDWKDALDKGMWRRRTDQILHYGC